MSHGHSGLGSGRQFSTLADHSKVDTDTTRGQLCVRLGWAVSQDGTILSPPPSDWEAAKRDPKVRWLIYLLFYLGIYRSS